MKTCRTLQILRKKQEFKVNIITADKVREDSCTVCHKGIES